MFFVGRTIAVKVQKSYSFSNLQTGKRLRPKRFVVYSYLRQNPRISSHAGGHWFESSSLHQILGNQVFPRIFSFLLQTSGLLIFCWNLKNQENTHMAKIKMPAANSISGCFAWPDGKHQSIGRHRMDYTASGFCRALCNESQGERSYAGIIGLSEPRTAPGL